MKPGSAGVPPALNTNHPPPSPHHLPLRKGWHSRGYLPHFDIGEIPQFITFRLTDSLPAELLNEWRMILSRLSTMEAETEIRKRIEEHLDQGTGRSWLKNPNIANMIENALLHFDGHRYFLHSWVVMPNHVHALLTPAADYDIPGIIQALKSFTAKEANRVLNRDGEFWQADYYDRYIRNEKHYNRTVEYIEMNPVTAGLCDSREEWPFSSAAKRGRAGGTPALPGSERTFDERMIINKRGEN